MSTTTTNTSLISTFNLRAKVHLHHVSVLQHSVVAAVGRVVRSHVVDRAASGERDAGLQ